MILDKIDRVHFIGVGGVSMSALAKLTLARGKEVSGSDAVFSSELAKLRRLGANVYGGFDLNAVMKAQLVVATAAVPESDRELAFAKKLNIPVMTRAEYLGLLSKDFKNVIAVAGTHGKTTVTAMTAAVFKNAGLSATAHIGGYSAATDGNFFYGGDEFFITEACEYKRGILRILPNLAVILNVESDHPDCFSDLKELYGVFDTYARNVISTGGDIIINGDCAYYRVNAGAYKDMLTFGLDNTNVCTAVNISEKEGKYAFDVRMRNQSYGHIRSPLYGKHNIYNVLAAVCICEHYHIDKRVVIDTLNSFCGVSRRMEQIGEVCGARVFCDYAHHPAEVAATLAAARKMTRGKVVVYFQPHTFSRTARLFDEFVLSLLPADYLGLVATFPAREKPSDGKSAFDLYLALKKERSACYFDTTSAAVFDIKKAATSGDLVLLLGAGDLAASFTSS